MGINLKKLQLLFEQEDNITRASKEYCKREGITFDDSFRRKCSKLLNSVKSEEIDDDLEVSTSTVTNQYNMGDAAPMSALKDDGSIMDISEYCEYYKLPENQVKSYKLITHAGKAAYYNVAFSSMEGDKFDEFYQNLLKELGEISTLPTTIKREVTDEREQFLLVIDPADCHIGKLAMSFDTDNEYNTNLAVQRVLEGVQGILNKVKGFPIDKILFVAGNDILHVDNAKRSTTSLTPQDTDGMWYSNFLIAKSLYIDVLKTLLEVADVHVVFNPSNHDYLSGFFLIDVVKTYFKDVENISFDSDMRHRKYFRYFDNLIGTSHGDGGKIANLPASMANEAKDWSSCRHRYIYTHHVHHKTSKDFIGVTVESLRSPSGTDSWHDRNQYTGVPKAIEGFLHSKTQGQIARITHIFF